MQVKLSDVVIITKTVRWVNSAGKLVRAKPRSPRGLWCIVEISYDAKLYTKKAFSKKGLSQKAIKKTISDMIGMILLEINETKK
jgi:hypothetical protein